MKTIPLSPVDHLFTGPLSQPITFAFHYSSRLDPDALRKSLDETLGHFPLLRSQLEKISDTDYGFRITGDGLSFECHESDARPDSASIESFIMPVRSVEGEPLTKIRLILYPEKSTLAVSISHAIVDGFSYFHFLSSWVRLHKGERILPPSSDREGLFPVPPPITKSITEKDILENCGLFLAERRKEVKTGPLRYETHPLKDDTLQSYLKQARQEKNLSFTENDVITAYLWKTYLPGWIHDGENLLTYMSCPFDFRRFRTGFPRMYFGCALCMATASVDLEGLLKASIGDLAVLIKEAVGRIRNEAIVRSLDTLDTFRRQRGLAAMNEIHIVHPGRGMLVTNLTRMPMRDLDFGSGAPGNFNAFVEVAPSAAILPAEDGVDLIVAHPGE